MQGDLDEILSLKDQEKFTLKIQVNKTLQEFGAILSENGYEITDISNNISCLVDSKNESIYLEIFKLAKKHAFNIRKITPYSQTLEDVFLDAYETENNTKTISEESI